MSAPILSRAEIYAAAIAYLQAAHRDPVTGVSPSLGPQAFLGHEGAAVSEIVSDIFETLRAVDNDAVPGGIYIDASGVTRTRNSTQVLNDWAWILALPKFGGGYGRNPALAARNGAATVSGTPAVVITAGSEATDPTGLVVVRTRLTEGDKTVGGGGTVGVILDAVTVGIQGNLSAGVTMRWTAPPPGLAATFTLSTALADGAGEETDLELAVRVVEELQYPPGGGRLVDWRIWSLISEDSNGDPIGIDEIYLYARRDGTGSVTVVPTKAGSGATRIPSTLMKNSLQTWLNAKKIESDTVYVVLPRVIAGQELLIVTHVTPEAGFEFDWTGSAQIYSGSAAALTLVLNVACPASLQTAILAGNKPRIALNLAGNALPFVTRVTARAIDTPGAGKTTLTLETALPTNVVTLTTCWPAGGCTTPIATSILAYLDNLGPSRAGLYASNIWHDKVTIGGIAAAALGARDSTSGELVCAVANDVGEAATTIAIGSGSATGADYSTVDSRTLGPQIPECKAITVKAA